MRVMNMMDPKVCDVKYKKQIPNLEEVASHNLARLEHSARCLSRITALALTELPIEVQLLVYE